MTRTVDCGQHGPRGPAFICGHALKAAFEKRPQSFFWTDAEADEPCGWCAYCQARYEAAGGDWVGEAEEKLDAKLICVDCFRDIIALNGYT
ncbi:hypothetical protein [Ovoidimarina sediminis]|uniref:hypothetical protein n=1 Tax=Ovoidimarina sediminis TaxID=3079856 RepID=UPI002914F211|nr:hypothetical protein [Rhodophyticola sp. MJ-SS7]MDU8945872.1 hypothetical protein [Rhodophyticola sp. MJ-SS7]